MTDKSDREIVEDDLGIDLPDAPDDRMDPETAGKQTGSAIAAAIWWPFAFIGSVFWGLIGFMPKRTRVYQKMIKAGYQAMYQKTNAHFVLNVVYGDGEIVPKPAEITEEGVKTKDDEQWTVEGQVNYNRVGDAPVATGVLDQHELIDPIAARIAEAVDLSPRRYRTVEQTPEGYEPVDWRDPVKRANEQSKAVADGGLANAQTDLRTIEATFRAVNEDELELDDAKRYLQKYLTKVREQLQSNVTQLQPSSTFDDIWVDVSNPKPDNDGWIVSMAKAYDLHWDRAGSEEMRQQEIRGRLAERDPEAGKRQQWMMLLAFAGGIALGMFGPAIAQSITGGGDGGGISMPVLYIGHLVGVM